MDKVKDKRLPKGRRGTKYTSIKMAPAGLIEVPWSHTKKRFPDLETDVVRKLHILEECFRFKTRPDYAVKFTHVAMALDLLHYYLRELEGLAEYRIQFDGLQIKYLMEAVDLLSKAYRRFGEPNFSWRIASIEEVMRAFDAIKPPEVSDVEESEGDTETEQGYPEDDV